MKKVERLDEMLMPDYHPDYWSDDVVVRASELVAQLDEEDWEMLLRIWRERTSGWQKRLADVLFSASHRQATTLLVELLQNTDLEVALLAAEGLADRVDHWTPPSTLRNVLSRLREQVGEGDEATIDMLIERIAP